MYHAIMAELSSYHDKVIMLIGQGYHAIISSENFTHCCYNLTYQKNYNEYYCL
jgi:hypothetical protein